MSENQLTIAQFLSKNKLKIQNALPRHLIADKVLSSVMTEIRKSPKLAKCTPESVLQCVLQCSFLGLCPGGALGHAYLIPYENKRTQKTICTFILGYKGMIDLARRSGQILSISARSVYENDEFELEFGINEKLRHKPAADESGKFLRVYAIAHLNGGSYQIDVMSKSEIDKCRNRSMSKNDGPWVTDYEEMAKKTVIRRLFKYLPVSIELQSAVALDEAQERGEQQDYIDADFEEVQEDNKDIAHEDEKSKSDKIVDDFFRE